MSVTLLLVCRCYGKGILKMSTLRIRTTEMLKPTESQRNFRAEASSVDWKLVDMSRNDREKAMGRIMDEIGELVELGDIRNLKQRCQLVCMLLAVVLVSKALLGVFCRYFVYPRTRSYMMIALAYDHFYDAVAQVFVISVNAIVFIWRG